MLYIFNFYKYKKNYRKIKKIIIFMEQWIFNKYIYLLNLLNLLSYDYL